MKKVILIVLGTAAGVFILLQFVPYGHDRSNPPVISEPQWNNPQTRALFFRVCRDCHSHETIWPWYSRVAPASWLVRRDVDVGRSEFNVSLWGVQKKNEGDDAADMVREGKMPPWFYVIAHPEAKFSEAEKQEFIAGLTATFNERRGRADDDDRDDERVDRDDRDDRNDRDDRDRRDDRDDRDRRDDRDDRDDRDRRDDRDDRDDDRDR